MYRNSAAVIDADGRCSACIARCTSRTIRSSTRSTTSRRATRPGRAIHAKGAGERLARVEDTLCEHRRADLLGSVVPRGGAHHVAVGRATSCSIRRRSAGIRRRRRSSGAAQVDAWRTMQRAHAIANGVYVAAPNRVGFEPEPGTDGLEFFGHSFVRIRSAGSIAEAGVDPRGAGRRSAIRDGASRIRGRQLAVLRGDRRNRRVRADPADRVAIGSSRRRSRCASAEWEPHDATWIAWPHHEPDWPGKLAPIPWVYGEIVRVLHAHERVEILCHDEQVRDARADVLEAHGVAPTRYRLHIVPNDRVWLRDSAPTAVHDATGARARQLGVQRVGQVRQLRARRARRRRRVARLTRPAARRADAPRHRRAASCSKAAASRPTARARCS